MSEFVSKVKARIRCSQGNFQLTCQKDIDAKHDAKIEIVTALGVEGGAGTRSQTGGGSLSGSFYREEKPLQVDWRRLYTTKEKFTMTYEDENGITQQYLFVQVTNWPNWKADNDGNVMDTVDMVFRRVKRIS